MLTSRVVTASISCVNSALSLVRLLNLQLPPLCTPSLQTGWTTVARSTLASLHVDWGPAFAARLIGGIPKFGHVSQYMLDVLHWLPAEQRISYRIASLVWRCLVGL